MGELAALVVVSSTSWMGSLLPLFLADSTWGMVVVGIVLAVFIAIVVFSTANRAAEEETRRDAESAEFGGDAGGAASEAQGDAAGNDSGNAAPAAGANPNKGLASVFGLGGPTVQPPPEQERAAKLGEPEQFGLVRESLVAVLDDMDATDAHFVVPDMALKRDLGLEDEQISRLLTDLGSRLDVAVMPEIFAKATGGDDLELRELLERLTGTYKEEANEEGATQGEDAER